MAFHYFFNSVILLCQGPAPFQGPWCSSAILTVRFPFTYLDNSAGWSLGTPPPPFPHTDASPPPMEESREVAVVGVVI